MLVEAVDHSPDYDVTVVAKNKQDEAQDIEQDKQEKAINKDLGKASKENVIEKTLRDIEQELEEGEYEVEKILKRRKRNNRFEYRYPLLVIVYNMLQLALRLTKHIVFCYSVEPFVDSCCTHLFS
eukprot:SAG22_NODE_95_length_20791_cov_40.318514_5_plen_125_part_00